MTQLIHRLFADEARARRLIAISGTAAAAIVLAIVVLDALLTR